MYEPLGKEPLDQKIFKYPPELLKLMKRGGMKTTIRMNKEGIEDQAMEWGNRLIKKYQYNY